MRIASYIYFGNAAPTDLTQLWAKPVGNDTYSLQIFNNGAWRPLVGNGGKSAYELAVEKGYTGTLDEWLLSLKGIQGNVGPQGEQGPAGPQGPQGEAGTSVTDISYSSETPTSTTYIMTFSDGSNFAFSIPKGQKGDKGDTGETGATGETGPKGDKGDTGAAGTNGTNGVDGEDAYQPFKGWFDSSSDLENTLGSPEVGDYAYVKGATASDPVAIYQCATAGTWTDSGHEFNPANNQEFLSGESLDAVRIVDDLTTGGATNVLSAKQGKELKGQIDALGPKIVQLGNELGMSEFEIGTININASTAWTYPTTTYQKRIRTPQGKEFYLTKGSIISLSDYTDAQFLLSCRDANGGYHGKITWQTADFVCEYSGYYVLVVANKTEVDLTEQTAAALAALVKITKYADIAYDNDFNEDGFVVKMAYDKGSDFVDGTSRTLTLKCALYYSKVGTKHLKGVYSINQTFTFPKNKFTYLLADVKTGAFTLTNDDTDLYVGGKVVLLSMTPSGYLQGHLAPWAYQRLMSAKHDADITTINNTINSMGGGVDFEIGNIYTYSNKIWVYADYQKRIRCKQPFRLTRGSIISLSDYTDAQFFLCCRDDDGVFHNQGTWLSTDFRCQYTGDYVLVVGNKTEVDLTEETAAALAATVKITPFADIANEKQGNCYFQFHGHPFYSHLLMDKQNANAIIPCQSIYDVNMAARLGFKFIEPSGAITSDGVYLCNHTVAATIDGATKQVFAGGVKYRGTTTPANDFAVNTKTAAWIRENCCYFSKYAKYESFVPTLEEFCVACRQNNIGVFLSANRMQDIETALSIIGPDNLIIYSSNIDFLLACRVRYDNITMMYYHNAAYTNADSCLATAYKIGKPLLYCIDVPIFNNLSDADMHEFVTKMHKNGYIVGMAANYTNEANARKAIKFGFDAFASGHHMNPFEGNLHHLCGDVTWDDFTISENNSSVVDGNLVLQNNGYIQGGDENTIHYLSKMNLLVKFNGTLNIYLSGSGSGGVQQVTSDGTKYEFFSDYGIEKATSFTITSVGETTIYGLQFDASKC